MNRRLLAPVVLTLVLALTLGAAALWLGPAPTPAVAQGAGTAPATGMRSLTVVGQGTAYASPDVAMVNLGVEAAAATVADATTENAQVMSAIMAALSDAGIAPEDISTVEYNIFLDQSLVSQGQAAVYRVVNTVSVTIRSLADVATILDAAITAGANRIYGISFSLSDPSAAAADARASAMADAQQRAQALAAEIGATVGSPLTISETSAYSVPFTTTGAPVAAAPAGAGPITPGVLSFISSVQVTYEMTGGSGLITLPAATATGPAATARATGTSVAAVTGTTLATGTAAGTTAATAQGTGTAVGTGTTAATVVGTPIAAGTATTLTTGTTVATVLASATPAAGATVATVTGAATSATAGTAITAAASAEALATTLPGVGVAAGRYITVVGAGTVTTAPDIASVDLGVDTTAADVRTAVDDNSQAMQAVLAALADAGVAPEDIRTSNYNIFLDQSGTMLAGNAQTQPAAPSYRVSNTVNVTIRNLDDVGAILDAVVAAGANNILGISFTREDWTDAEQQARALAIADAQARASQLSQLAGLRLVQVLEISEVITGGPIAATRQAAVGLGGGAAPISSGQLQFGMNVQVVYTIE